MWRVPCSLDGCRRGCSVWPPCARVAARRGREQPLLSFREGRRSTQVRPLPKGPVLYFRRTHVPRRRVVHRETKNQKIMCSARFFTSFRRRKAQQFQLEHGSKLLPISLSRRRAATRAV
jgi:hypothetical protein